MSVKKQYLICTVRGFTLVELVIIIMIVGIISVIAIPKWQNNSMGLEYEARRILNDIRFTQAMSMTSGQRYRWVMVSSSTYSVLNEAGTAMLLPSGSTVATLSRTTIGALTNLPNSLIAFDSQGTPYTTSTFPGTALASTASINLSASGSTRVIQISAGTGYGVLQ